MVKVYIFNAPPLPTTTMFALTATTVVGVSNDRSYTNDGDLSTFEPLVMATGKLLSNSKVAAQHISRINERHFIC